MADFVQETEIYSNKRIAWGAVFAGMVVVLVTQLVLTLLGVAFGAGSIDPIEEANPVEGLGMGAGIWLLLTALVSLFAGGWVSGRLATSTNNVDSMLHGVVTWGLASLVSFFLVTTAVGGVLSGAAGLLGKVAGIAGQGIKAAVPEVAKTVGEQWGIDTATLSGIKAEARTILAQTGKPELQPRALEKQTGRALEEAERAAEEVAKQPQALDREFEGLIDRVFARGKAVLDAADKEAMVNVLVSRTNLSRTEANRTVDNWIATAQAGKEKLAETARMAEQKTREAADAAAKSLSKAAIWSFIALVLGLVASAIGGWLGSPARTPLGSTRTWERRAA
jgi:hypothetical protein